MLFSGAMKSIVVEKLSHVRGKAIQVLVALGMIQGRKGSKKRTAVEPSGSKALPMAEGGSTGLCSASGYMHFTELRVPKTSRINPLGL